MRIIVFCLLALFIQEISQSQSIIGTWQLSPKETYEKLKDIGILENMGSTNYEQFERELGNLKIAFYSNQVMAVSNISFNQTEVLKGNWQYTKDEQEMIFMIDGNASRDSIRILELSKQKLILEQKSKSMTLIFQPSKVVIDTSKATNIVKEETTEVSAISQELLIEIIRSIPTPLEIAFLTQDLGIPYQSNLLAKTNQNASNDLKRAWQIGVFGCDLGYANIYEEKTDARQYLEAIKSKTDEMNVAHLIDFNTIESLMTESTDLDSLLLITDQNLRALNGHFVKKNKGEWTVVILSGGWLESLYLITQIQAKNANELLKNRIGEQEIILDQLLLLFSFYSDINEVKILMKDFEALKEIYEEVNVNYTYEESDEEMDEESDESGIIILEDNTTTFMTISEEVTEKIRLKVAEIRNKYLN